MNHNLISSFFSLAVRVRPGSRGSGKIDRLMASTIDEAIVKMRKAVAAQTRLDAESEESARPPRRE